MVVTASLFGGGALTGTGTGPLASVPGPVIGGCARTGARAVPARGLTVPGSDGEDILLQSRQAGVAGDDVGEALAIDDVLVEVKVVESLQVVEPVSLLQAVELLLQHDPEGLADHAAVDVLLGEAADPEVDPVDAGDDLGPVRPVMQDDVRVHRREGCLLGRRGEGEIGIGLLELRDDRVAQPVAGLEVFPGRVGVEVTGIAHGLADVGVARCFQVGPDLVQGAEPDVAPPRHVEGEEVGVDAHEVVAHRVHDIEVDLLGRLRRHPGEDGARPELSVAGCGT